MIKDFCSGINCKRAFFAFGAVFAVIFATDFLIHGKLLADAYHATASLWRSEAEMRDGGFCLWMLLGQLLIAKMFVVIFAKGYEGKGPAEGVRFGLLAGLFSVSHCFIQYAVTPIPRSLLLVWVATGLMQMILAGIVAALVYRR